MRYRPFHISLGTQYNWPQAPIPGIIPEQWGLTPVDEAPPANGGAPPAPPAAPSPGVIGPAPWIYQPSSPAPYPGTTYTPGIMVFSSGVAAPSSGIQHILPAGYADSRSYYQAEAEAGLSVLEDEETPSTPLKVAKWGLLALLIAGTAAVVAS